MVHCFTMHGINVAYDTIGNALHVVGDAEAALVAAWSAERRAFDNEAVRGAEAKFGYTEAAEATQAVGGLIADGQLFVPEGGGSSEDAGSKIQEDAEGAEAAKIADAANAIETAEAEAVAAALAGTYVFKSLCLHLAHDCNMRCAYCFASEGSFGQKRELMSYETACAAIDFAIASSAGRRNIEIDYFGGEPLLNYDVLKRATAYAKSREVAAGKKFRFTLTTNGLLLDDETIAYINDNMDNLVLSLDGREAVNDRMRRSPGGAGTYATVVEKFKKAVKNRRSDWYIRGTYTAYNRDFSSDVLHLADLGFANISVEPVVSSHNKSLEFGGGDIAALSAEYEKLAYAMHEREKRGDAINFFHFNVDLDGGPCLARRVKGCGAGYEYAAVAPNGDIYPCHQFVGNAGFLLGSVYFGINNSGLSEQLKKTNIYAKNDCMACWAKYLCGGGCAANAWFYNKDINKPNGLYCALFRKRIECALWLKCVRVVDAA